MKGYSRSLSHVPLKNSRNTDVGPPVQCRYGSENRPGMHRGRRRGGGSVILCCYDDVPQPRWLTGRVATAHTLDGRVAEGTQLLFMLNLRRK
ncbi:hypothetical protein NHX12_001429 [Muraenolepis orangiensis]|uniref:Uncharacterized protein n=1 Tax=Muraenolepis orangiensis TaxID=630683 RepID=A0A9Q0IH92_9TELE|nr:hypothetical protein NHX12_001429 [Muraenolepis orangiensis]